MKIVELKVLVLPGQFASNLGKVCSKQLLVALQLLYMSLHLQILLVQLIQPVLRRLQTVGLHSQYSGFTFSVHATYTHSVHQSRKYAPVQKFEIREAKY